MRAEPQPADKLVGQVLADRYQILHRLGEGAMGVVYKARHVKVGRLFAVKVLHPRTLVDPKVAQRFAREAELAGRLRHPNVVGVVDVGEIDATRYMVMDFAEGPDLAKLLDEAPMPPQRIIHLVRQMLEGLYHAHEQGLIHRDFKPENVIVERDAHGAETPRIVDFGIALLREGSGSVDGKGRLTTNGLVLGTPHYMAPEQAVADPIDHRIDLFALGIVIYEMLSGRLPFDGSGAEVARANLLLDPPLIKQRVPHLEVDPLLEAFGRRLMAKRREARPATARAARELLDLIEQDRARAATLLGVPLARSGRAPAATEPVDVEQGSTQPWVDATVPMKPTPRPAPPVVVPPSAPPASALPAASVAAGAAAEPVPAPDAIAPPDGAGGPPGPVVYPPHPLARRADGDHGPRYPNPHRDTALRTPLGWQTASLPNRRRSWLIGGFAIGAVAVIAAAVLAFTHVTRDGEAGDRHAGAGSVAAAPPASSMGPRRDDPAPAVEPAGAREATGPAASAAAPSGPTRAAAPSGPPSAAATNHRAVDDTHGRGVPRPSRASSKPGGGTPEATGRSTGTRSAADPPAAGSTASAPAARVHRRRGARSDARARDAQGCDAGTRDARADRNARDQGRQGGSSSAGGVAGAGGSFTGGAPGAVRHRVARARPAAAGQESRSDESDADVQDPGRDAGQAGRSRRRGRAAAADPRRGPAPQGALTDPGAVFALPPCCPGGDAAICCTPADHRRGRCSHRPTGPMPAAARRLLVGASSATPLRGRDRGGHAIADRAAAGGRRSRRSGWMPVCSAVR
ncbi:MAG: hypothetical protein E6J91_24315 [Deltaproteobacteria bacterium]|nr:MAG: hypothetical protein E6J91_24315 [Deltaproteobacteria bacterium]